jgi:hypothetical protein
MNSPALCPKLLHLRNMGFRGPERKDKISAGPANLGTKEHRRYMLPVYAERVIYDFCADSEGFEVRAMAAGGRNRRRMGFLPLLTAVALAACAGLPAIGGQQLPKDPTPAVPPTYRDLADIPEPPVISPPEANQEAIQALMADRAKAAQTVEDLRSQPFTMPDPSTPPGF